ncbi:MAG: cyclic nucleotide-binding domain-containing protein [Candidatus Eremiobacteraeota bacterium]|nr:cyclic nucleotide-binding domain-containing protein [Candidatus Eremiobacteraeota bacterium]MCW5867415.1 cyclic nucleotide-binding domain-containing protein [Candidatus Eremiobacteraeota bacterium]
MSEFLVRELNRGGLLAERGNFTLQVGAYPETIKDTMTAKQGVPDLFLVPRELFDHQLGISAVELEFPLYYNFYLKKRKLRFVCHRSQLRAILRVLKESLFGPTSLRHDLEYRHGSDSPGFPDLVKEMAYFKKDPSLPRGRLRLADCILPILFNESGRCEVDGVTICDLGNDEYRLEAEGDSRDFRFVAGCGVEPPSSESPPSEYHPPTFGITLIGSGHGFDSKAKTSGFVIWLDGKGVLIDPPVHTTAWLKSQGINPRSIEDIVLTHCHADHDSGTLQKVLQEGRVRLHTSPTILQSFTRKYRALTGLSQTQFLSLFDFHPVMLDESVNIAGGTFRFQYRFHPVPTLGFETFFRGKSFAYSCDTLWDPEVLQKLADEGLFSPSRAEDLIDFPWHHTLVLHEAGIPPIHTPVSVLARLPAEVKEHIHLVHISDSAIPEDSGLRLAPTGAADSLIIPVPETELSLAQRSLDLLAHIDLFRSLNVDKAAEFLRFAQYRSYDAGEQVIQSGQPGNDFYMIMSGEAEIRRQGVTFRVLSRYEYFGEFAVVEDSPRMADVFARTKLEVLIMSRYDFLCFLRGTPLLPLFRRVARNRLHYAEDLVQLNPRLSELTSYQRSQLMSLLLPRKVEEGQVLYERGSELTHYYIVAEGSFRLEGLDGPPVIATPGVFLGQVSLDLDTGYHIRTAVAETKSRVLEAPVSQMLDFFRMNPGFTFRLGRHAAENHYC